MNTTSYVTNNFSQDKYNDILSASGYIYVSSNNSCIYRFPKNIYTPDFLNTTNTSDFYSNYLLA
jgi:hypothetical protein